MNAITDAAKLRIVSLDRPEKRDALTSQRSRDLEAAVEDAESDVVYVPGEGLAFRAGPRTSRGAVAVEAGDKAPGPGLRDSREETEAAERGHSRTG